MRLNTKCPTHNDDSMQLVEDASREMTKVSTEVERDKLRSILLKHREVFSFKADTLGMCPYVEHSIELRDDTRVIEAVEMLTG